MVKVGIDIFVTTSGLLLLDFSRSLNVLKIQRKTQLFFKKKKGGLHFEI